MLLFSLRPPLGCAAEQLWLLLWTTLTCLPRPQGRILHPVFPTSFNISPLQTITTHICILKVSSWTGVIDENEDNYKLSILMDLH